MTRLQKIKQLLQKDFDALLVSSIPNIIYLTCFRGFSDQEREAYLLLTKGKNYIFSNGLYSQTAREIKNFELIEISSGKKV